MDFPLLEKNNPVTLLQNSVFTLWQNCVHLSDPDDDSEIINITNQLNFILKKIETDIVSPSNETIHESISISILNNLLCFLVYVRDIHMGLGYRKLSYSMISTWYKYYPDLTKSIIQLLLQKNNNSFSFGSWRDICDLCNFLKNNTPQSIDHPLISYLVSIMNDTLYDDWQIYLQNKTCNTNVAKWVPRESSKKNNWIFQLLFLDWSKKHTHYLNNNNKSYYASLLKCKMKYRQMVSTLTKIIRPIECFLCAKQNDQIFFPYISNKSLVFYWDILFNQTDNFQEKYNGNFQEKYANSIKHNICVNNISYFIKNMKNILIFNYNLPSSNHIYFPKYLNNYVKLAIRSIKAIEQYSVNISNCPRLTEEISILNDKWNYMFQNWNKLNFIETNSIAVVNIHILSLNDPAFYNAISHACFIAQSSNIKRILFSAHIPIWINIENATNFVDIIRIIYNSLKNDILINTDIDNSIKILGKDNPFIPIIITQNGYCYKYNHEYSFNDFFSIMDSPRYKNIQNIIL